MHATKKLMIAGMISLLLISVLAVAASAAMRGAGGSGGGGGGGSSGGGGGSLAGSGGRGSAGGFRTIIPKLTPEAVTLFTYEGITVLFNNGKYPVKIGLISIDKADFSVGPVTETLYLNKPVVYDLNKDGKGDVSFALLKTGHNVVTIEMVLAFTPAGTPAVSAPSAPSSPLAEPETGKAVAAVPAVSAPTAPSDFVEVTKDATSVGGWSVSNKAISAVLLAIAGIVIFKFWRRQRAPKQ